MSISTLIIIATFDLKQHLKLLDQVLQAITTAVLHVNLGNQISFNSIQPDPSKIQGIQDAQAPRNKKELATFLGAVSYLRQFLPGLATDTEPLDDMRKKQVEFVWNTPQQYAFETIKEAVVAAVTLSMANPALPFTLYTDASNTAVGAALVQFSKETPQFIMFASQRLSATQRNWSTNEREVWAIIWALEKCESFVAGTQVTVFTDQKSLSFLANAQAGKLRRWALRLMEYRPIIRYIKGTDNNLADWMSRSLYEPGAHDLVDQITVPPFAQGYEVYLGISLDATYPLPSPQEIAQAAREEPESVQRLLRWVDETPVSKRSNRLYIPLKFVPRILFWLHGSRYSGHCGINKTM